METMFEIIPQNCFGELLPYLEDDAITDINYNGRDVWVDHIYQGRYKIDVELTEDFINTFIMRVKNSVSKSFNQEHNVLEAETADLRISIIHDSVAKSGVAISIRKTPPISRLDRQMMIDTEYASVPILNFLENCIKASCNIIIAGITGSGKTELLKWLTGFIPENEKVITIEDNLEIRYSKINPGKDCVELKVDDQRFGYPKAIKTCLRQMPKWIILSEARSREVKFLLEAFSTGHNGLTTIHCDDVDKIPRRIKNMMQLEISADVIYEDIFNFFDIGILVNRRLANNEIQRWIDQICIFDYAAGKCQMVVLVDEGKLKQPPLPLKLRRKFQRNGIKFPYQKYGDNHSGQEGGNRSPR